MGLPVAQILGGLISFAFQHVEDAELEGWRIMFLVLGAVTILIGAGAVYVLPDSPMKVKWLSEREKVALLLHISENRTGVENRRFERAQLKELVLDPQIWLLTLINCLVRICIFFPPSKRCQESYRFRTNSGIDRYIKRSHKRLLLNHNQAVRIHFQRSSAAQHAIWAHIIRLRPPRRLWCETHISPLGLAPIMLHPGHSRRRINVLRL